MKLYTLPEASNLLPELTPVLESLRDAYRDLQALRTSVAAEARGASGDGHLLADPWAEAVGEDRRGSAADTLQVAARKLEEWGIEVKAPEKGLIDFFHQRDDRVVYLCYLLGEPKISFWHELNAGFAGRQPL